MLHIYLPLSHQYVSSWKCILLFKSTVYIHVHFRLDFVLEGDTMNPDQTATLRSSLIWVHIACNIGRRDSRPPKANWKELISIIRFNIWITKWSGSTQTFLTLCLLVNFASFFVVCWLFFNFYEKFFQEYHQSVKQFKHTHLLFWIQIMFCRAWSGSKLFAKIISRWH